MTSRGDSEQIVGLTPVVEGGSDLVKELLASRPGVGPINAGY